ncbi:MAG TPA: glucose 1-dehydrogenase [Gemmatimonadaceae bacterium]|nr:glucose 1-dehydrogenase [Gemmatimonadaceae bacterium]
MTSLQNSIDLRGKRALVTGASRGIGAATVKLLAAAGADVVVGYNTRRADAETVAEYARSLGVRSISVAADVSTRAGSGMLIGTTLAELGGLDIFVGNAGIWPPDDVSLAEMSDEQWERTIRQNLDSIFYTTRDAVHVMTDGGRIVLVSSTAGQRGEAYHSDYAATKGAIISFTKSLAVELGPRNINVNCVAPGWVDTEMVQDAIADEGLERISSAIPLGRIATADDIAGPIVFLCSPMARHITGEALNVNGGSVLCG